MSSSAIAIGLLFLTAVLSCARASHFRGISIQWRPVEQENFDGQIIFNHRIAWRRSSGFECTEAERGNTSVLFGGGHRLNCHIGCSGSVGFLQFYCTDFSLLEDWTSGERSFVYNISTSVDYFEAIFSGCCWIHGLQVGSSSRWSAIVKGSLVARPDGRINSSPVTATTPIVRLQQGCQYVLQIPVEDADRDTIRCRWASGASECHGVCNAFPNAVLDSEQCTLSYNAIYGVAWFAVALQIEDFLPSDLTTPLSSVPLQFLVNVFASNAPCSAQPMLVSIPGETPVDGACIPVEFDTTYTAGIVASSGGGGVSIAEFLTVSPSGLVQSAVMQSQYDPELYYINVTWTATLERFGIHIFCYSARNSAGQTSEQSCITLLGGVRGPRILAESLTPTGALSPSPSTVWSVTFDQTIKRPDNPKFIRIFEDNDLEVHAIDVTSTDVTFPELGSEGTTLTFQVDYQFTPGQKYYILIDGGAVVGDMFCNQESHHITDTSFWTFTVASIQLSPRFGNMLGGTPILIDPGVPLQSTDKVTCRFGENEEDGIRINDNLALCVSPSFQHSGFVPFTLEIADRPPQESEFLSISPEKAHAVGISSEGLYLSGGDMVTITWDPELLVPNQISTEDIKVDISVYRQQLNIRTGEFQWSRFDDLASDTMNDGNETVTIFSARLTCLYHRRGVFNICPVAIRVSVSNTFLPSSIASWSGVLFYESDKIRNKAQTFRQQCIDWSENEESVSSALSQLRACPPNPLVASFDIELERENRSSILNPSTFYEKQYMNYFHPGVDVCFRQSVPSAGQSGQQCCYNTESLIVGSAGGSPDRFSPKGLKNFNQHILQDLTPFILCCKTGFTKCSAYYDARPSGGDENYQFPVPACVYGDPHVVTLDGHKYTFNGKGEFTLIETDGNLFSLQGRMEQPLDPDGSPAPGTVFTAIVARQIDTETSVQFEVDMGELQVRVNEEVVTFGDVAEQEFEHVTLLDRGNGSVLAIFPFGATVEARVENEIISVLLVGLPESLRSKTRGLMGTFNGITLDDLVPKYQDKSIPLESSLEEIHDLFGITWIIDNADDSWFYYAPGTRWSDFYHPNFSPMFEAAFDNPELEMEARGVCGDDEFCLFDIAATKKVEIGMTTMQGGEDFDRFVEISVPIICDPPCDNGVCLENNVCHCNEGYEGHRCTEPVMEECDADFCENDGTCVKQGLTYSCQCTEEYEGSLCENRVPPFHLRLINGSPRVTSNGVSIDFVASKPATSNCFLTGLSFQDQTDCSSGNIQYNDIPDGRYTLRISARTASKERDVIRRKIFISPCAVHLINEGITFNQEQNTTTIQFVGTQDVTGYQCRLDDAEDFVFCLSPQHYSGMDVGEHRLIVRPMGCEGERLSVKFEVA